MISKVNRTRFPNLRQSEVRRGIFFFFRREKLSATIREAGGEGWAKSARRAAAICQHMPSFLSQTDHYGPIGNKQMSSSAWQSTMMNNHGCGGVRRVTGALCHRHKVTQGDWGAADQTPRRARGRFLFAKCMCVCVGCIKVYISRVGRRAKTESVSDVFSAVEEISQVKLWFSSEKKILKKKTTQHFRPPEHENIFFFFWGGAGGGVEFQSEKHQNKKSDFSF